VGETPDTLKRGATTMKSLLAFIFGAIVGVIIVAKATEAIPKMMPKIMANMMAQMGGEGCSPAEM